MSESIPLTSYASFLSPTINIPSLASTCIQFVYHIYGEGTASMDVSWKKDGVSKKLWQQSHDQGDMWHLAQVWSSYSTDTRVTDKRT